MNFRLQSIYAVLLMTLVCFSGCNRKVSDSDPVITRVREEDRQKAFDDYAEFLYPVMQEEFERIKSNPVTSERQLLAAYRHMGSALSVTGQWDSLHKLYSALSLQQKKEAGYFDHLLQISELYPQYRQQSFRESMELISEEWKRGLSENFLYPVPMLQLTGGYYDDLIETLSNIKPSPRSVYLYCRVADVFIYTGRKAEGEELLAKVRDIIRSLDENEKDSAQSEYDAYMKISMPFTPDILKKHFNPYDPDDEFGGVPLYETRRYCDMLARRSDTKGVSAVQGFLYKEYMSHVTKQAKYELGFFDPLSYHCVGPAPAYHIDLLDRLDIYSPEHNQNIVNCALEVYQTLACTPDKEHLQKVDSVLRKSLAKLPPEKQSAKAYMIMYNIAEYLGNKEEMQQAASRILEISQTAQNDIQNAKRIVERLRSEPRDIQTAIALMRTGQSEGLKKYCQRLQSSGKKPVSIVAEACLAASFARQDRFEEAMEIIESLPGDSPVLLSGRVIFEHFRAGNPDKAKQLVKKDLELIASSQEKLTPKQSLIRLSTVCQALSGATFPAEEFFMQIRK